MTDNDKNNNSWGFKLAFRSFRLTIDKSFQHVQKRTTQFSKIVQKHPKALNEIRDGVIGLVVGHVLHSLCHIHHGSSVLLEAYAELEEEEQINKNDHKEKN